MQRYEISNARTRAKLGIRYIGGVGTYDVFWVADRRRLVVKWDPQWGNTCAVGEDGAEDIWPLAKINGRLERRIGPAMTEEEHTVLQAMRKLFVVE